MASEILTADINEIFPVAGQDNDSQGFRDNFRLVKTGLATAATEITSLQTSSAKLNATNDFNGNIIREANLIANSEEVYVSTEITGSQNVRFVNGNYQILTVGADVTLTLTDWPATGKLGKIRLAIKGDGTNRLVTFSPGPNNVIKTDSIWRALVDSVGGAIPNNALIVSSTTDPTFVDLWSSDGGLTVYGQHYGQFTV
jgi:hypothetical protein|tara:strand:- start:1634 stop:2230 length:597 start_codon:yes stop_codon:yes gene_type:complete